MMEDVGQRYGLEKKWRSSDFQIGEKLGEGAYGVVFRAREKNTGFIVALKSLNKLRFRNRFNKNLVMREIGIHSRLKHPNVLKLYNYYWDGQDITLILELAALGELTEILKQCKNHRCDPTTAARYISQVTSALEYCQQMHVMHRDIKPENILLDINGVPKLADFGYSVHAPSNLRHTFCGTLTYLAPEIIRGGPYTNKVDNWSLGILLFELYTGELPFDDCSDDVVRRLILRGKPEYPTFMEPEVVDLIGKLLQQDPTKRISFREVLEHPWILKHIGQSEI